MPRLNGELFHHQQEFLLWMILQRMEQQGLVKNESVGVVMQNCKQRATQTRAKTEITATIETTAAMRATTRRGEEVPYHCGEKNTNCRFCVSKLKSTTGTMLYPHLGRYIITSIQTNLGQIYVRYV